jgi:Flp pilus assembly protein TadG
VTLALPVLIGMTGFAVDMGRLYAAKARLQASVDAAALAGSLYLSSDPNVSNGQVANSVNEYLFKNYPEASVTELKPGTSIRSVCVTAQVSVPMTFMAVLAVNSKIVSASSCAGFNDLEVVLIIDNTGSMDGAPINAVKTAAKKLVDLMMPTGGAPSIKVGLVPFRGKVYVNNWEDGKAPGCRNANGSVNPDLGTCQNGGLQPILELAYNKSSIKTSINNMQATGGLSGTVISEGIKWGREVLTPDWPYSQGGPSSRFRKVMILLTDGDTEDGYCGGFYACTPYTSCNYRFNAYFGMGVTNCHCEDGGCLNAALLNEAQIAKDNGIEIFTIRYGDSDFVDIQMMKTVASSTNGTEDHYFDAPATTDIGKVFDKIGRQLGYRLL